MSELTGYYRHPTISGDTLVFVAEDDLWAVDATAGGTATRLTASPGSVSGPRFSPDGSTLAFMSRDEGQLEAHVMDAGGGPTRRLSYLGALTKTAGWTADGTAVIVASTALKAFAGMMELLELPLDSAAVKPLGLGPARAISFEPGGKGVALGRQWRDPALWKRYRGGRAGTIWVDRTGSGDFVKLVDVPGNLVDPMWIGRRIYFLSDHEGVGNIYSVTPTGRSLQRHTHHEDFYARNPSTDGRSIVYHSGGDLYRFDVVGDQVAQLEVTIPSTRPQRARKFHAPGRFLDSAALHPQGHSMAVVARGAAFTMPLWEGAPRRHGPVSTARQRLATFLADGERFVAVSDEGGEEALVVRAADGSGEPTVIEGDFGRAMELSTAPAGRDRVALTNHRHELIMVNLETKRSTVVHRSPSHWILGHSWSPDGRWIAFAAAPDPSSMCIYLYDTNRRRLSQISRPDFFDAYPSFDPGGKYLYFLSIRNYNPVIDGPFHDYSFPGSVAPYAMMLDRETPSPFSVAHREPRPPGAPPGNGKPDNNDKGDDAPPTTAITLAGLADRVVAFPVPEGNYFRVEGAAGRALFGSRPVRGSLNEHWAAGPGPTGKLEAWDFASEKVEPVVDGISDFAVSHDGKTVAIVAGRKLRVVPAAFREQEKAPDKPGRESGWIDLNRVRIEVDPGAEWQQMFREAWRLQRDLYWSADMGQINWRAIHNRYLPLVDRVGTRAEFSDLLWVMQGELGTSHAYELGGDYRPEPAYTLGRLGADLRLARSNWTIERILRGDSWKGAASSPLSAPGIDVREGDRIVAVNGVRVDRRTSPQQLLVDQGGRPVTLTVSRGRSRPRDVVVTALPSEAELRYRDWVESNRARVAELTKGRAGYLHIPDMGPRGFSEFHRYFRSEVNKDGLVVDVRFNGGGNVSQLLLEKLLRKRLGYRITRWRAPYAFPSDSPMGPMVAITNEDAGSDGDIFSHTWKLHGLGPLIGTRTWGGVVGIWPQHWLVDGTLTTQPEFASWYFDVDYGVENYGTDPDIEVVITPQDHRAGRDTQLERAVGELTAIIDAAEPLMPKFPKAPSVKPPKLPSAPD